MPTCDQAHKDTHVAYTTVKKQSHTCVNYLLILTLFEDAVANASVE
jgi:hypothetical protein